jgi:hypothetical protein
MKFREVPSRLLEKDVKYKIKWHTFEYTGYFHQYYLNYADFKNVNSYDILIPFIGFRLDKHLKFYQPTFSKAQQNMERRAINLVLQRLIPYYEW